MNRNLVKQTSIFNGDQFNVMPGRISGITLYFLGTNATGVTGDFDDLGSVIVKRDTRQIANISVGRLADITDIRFGSNLLDSSEGSTFEAATFLPFFESDQSDEKYNNALAITGEKELNFEWVPAAGVADIFDSCRVSVYAELAAYEEKYEFRTLRNDIPLSAAVSADPNPINKDNVSSIYLTDPDDIVDLVQVEASGRTVYSPQPWGVLEFGTLRDNRLETTTFGMVALPIYTHGKAGSSVNRNATVTLTTSGAGSVGMITTSLHWWSKR